MRALRRLFGPLTVALALSTILSTGASAGRPPSALGLPSRPHGARRRLVEHGLDIVRTRARVVTMFFGWNGPKVAPIPRTCSTSCSRPPSDVSDAGQHLPARRGRLFGSPT
jgi:hypothetical protein